MNKLKMIIAGFVTLTILGAPSFASATSLNFGATSKSESCQALRDISPDGGGCQNPDGSSITEIMKLVINIISIIAGIIAVIMLIVSGLKYVTSQGDANAISSAKQSLIYAIVGLVVVAFSQAIVQFVLARSLSA